MNDKPKDEELVEQLTYAVESFGKADRSFHCARCGQHFTPRRQQWIFYQACDACFSLFDAQKMRGRFGEAGCTESFLDWLDRQRS